MAEASESRLSEQSDKVAVENTHRFAKEYEKELIDIKEYFLQKGWFGLWLDHAGFFGSSDPNEICENLEEFLKLARHLMEVTQMVERGDCDSYEKLLEFYSELKEKEEEAERGMKKSKSSTVIKMYRDFLQTKKIEMDRKLSKVECAAQRILIKDIKNDMREIKEEAKERKKECKLLEDINKKLETAKEKAEEEASKQCEALRQQNLHWKKADEEAKKRHETLHQENQLLKEAFSKSDEEAKKRYDDLQKENQNLRETLEELNKKADERSKNLHEENQMLREMLEESSKKADDRLLKLLEIIKERQS